MKQTNETLRRWLHINNAWETQGADETNLQFYYDVENGVFAYLYNTLKQAIRRGDKTITINAKGFIIDELTQCNATDEVKTAIYNNIMETIQETQEYFIIEETGVNVDVDINNGDVTFTT